MLGLPRYKKNYIFGYYGHIAISGMSRIHPNSSIQRYKFTAPLAYRHQGSTELVVSSSDPKLYQHQFVRLRKTDL